MKQAPRATTTSPTDEPWRSLAPEGPTLPALAKSSYRPDIDGLRAVAVLAVVVYHVFPKYLPGGFAGVDVFFVVSGFVVTSSLAGSKSRGFLSYVGEFYARRLARILPALVAVLMTTAVAATCFIPHAWLSGLSERTALFAFFGLSNWVMQHNFDTYFAPRAEFNPYTHTWSLGVEEQFYLVAPLLVFLWLTARSRRAPALTRAAMAFFAGVSALSLALAIYYSSTSPETAFYSIGCRFWELGAGAFLFMAGGPAGGRAESGPRTATLRLVGAGLGALLVGVGFFLADSAGFPWPWALPAVVGTLLLVHTGTGAPISPIHRALGSAPFLWVGRRSYSIYLWHWPVLVLMRWTTGLHMPLLYAVAVVVSVGLAALSYRWVEQPLRHNVRLERLPSLARIGLFLSFPFFGALFASHLFAHADRYSLSTVSRNQADWYAGERMPAQAFGARRCHVELKYHDLVGGSGVTFTPTECHGTLPPHKLTVVGDSHAHVYEPALEQLSAELGLSISVHLLTGCPYLWLLGPMSSVATQGCKERARLVSERLLRESRPGDVLFLPSLRLPRYGDQWASFDVPDMRAAMNAPGMEQTREAAVVEASDWLKPFAERGVHVVFEAPTPMFKSPPYRCSDWFNRWNPICAGGTEQPRAEQEAVRAPILASMAKLSSESKSVSLWDPFYVLCPEETCRAVIDGRPLFFDGDHLSAFGTVTVYPSLKKQMTELLGPP